MSKGGSGEDAERDNGSKLTTNPYYKILGFQQEHIVAVVKESGEKIRIRYRDAGYGMSQLVLADSDHWKKVSGKNRWSIKDKQEIGRGLIEGARAIGAYNSRLERQRGVYLDGNRLVVHLGDQLYFPEESPPRYGDLFDDSADGLYLPEASLGLNDESAGADARVAVVEALRGFRWVSKGDMMALLGWMACSIVGGALKWRPHIWLSGPSGSGKTWLIDNIVMPFLGEWATLISGRVSAAGVVRLIGSSALPVIFDEAEMEGPQRDAVRSQILQIMRIASSGQGRTLKADGASDLGVVTTQPRCCFMLSSIAMVDGSRADVTRTTKIRLSPAGLPMGQWASLERDALAAMENAGAIHADLVRGGRRVLELCAAARAALASADPSMPTRIIEQLGALAGGAAWWTGDLDDALDAVLNHQRDLPVTEDGELLLQTILALDPVAKGLAGNGEVDMEWLGVRRDANGRLLISAKSMALNQALGKSRFGGQDLFSLLLQIPGAAQEKQRRFGGARHRGVVSVPFGNGEDEIDIQED